MLEGKIVFSYLEFPNAYRFLHIPGYSIAIADRLGYRCQEQAKRSGWRSIQASRVEQPLRTSSLESVYDKRSIGRVQHKQSGSAGLGAGSGKSLPAKTRVLVQWVERRNQGTNGPGGGYGGIDSPQPK